MKYNYDITIIIPGVRNNYWNDMYEQICHACKEYSMEIIFSGPFPLTSELQKNDKVKYIKNFGSPTRALCLANLISEGRFFTWLTDDSWINKDSIDECLDLLSKNSEKDIVCMRYAEGEGHGGSQREKIETWKPMPDAYWTAGHHDSLRLPGINPEWKIGPILMVNNDYYHELGGFDCRFEHMNMNIHDFAFRAQMNGSTVHLSPSLIMNMDWDSKRTKENSNLIAAYHYNDLPLFKEIYTVPNTRPIKIAENWRDCEVVWNRKSY